VHDTLQALVPAAAKINGSWHHSHERRIPQLRGTTCYVMSVRDPAERLRSGFYYDRLAWIVDTERYFFKSVGQYIRALAEPDHPEHASAMRNYWSSVALPEYRNQPWSRYNRGVVGGNHFLVSQVDYLRSLHCDLQHVFFVCTETLSSDLSALGNRYGLVAPIKHNNQRIGSHNKSHLLSEQEATFVRQCLYPWDTALYNSLCGPGVKS
jgi:hypothetical protein